MSDEANVRPRAANSAPQDRGVLLHAGVLVVAVVSALGLWMRDKEGSKPLVSGDVTVWSGRAADVKRMTYESKTKKTTLESKEDATGRYFMGTFEKEASIAKPLGDAGAGVKSASKTVLTLISVGEAGKVADALAPLKALRDLGNVASDRLSEFGLATPDGTLTVDVGGTEHKLLVGSAAGATGDRYVKDPASGSVYAIKGDLVKDLDGADTRMIEHDLHEWKDSEIKAATVKGDGKTRELVRVVDGSKRHWADKATPAAPDEAFANWITKLERLRPTEYVGAPPDKKETIVRIEYSAGRPLGWVELMKAPGEKGKADYFILSERTRLPAKVTTTTAEQIEQELGSVLK